MATSKQRIPPHSLEAEQSVLGSMLLDANAVITAMETLKSEDFYSAGHRAIYEAMEVLYAASMPIDLVTVIDKLEQRGTMKLSGDMEYLSELSRAVPTTTNVAQYVAIVEDRAVLREVIQAGSQMVADGFAAERPGDVVVSDAHDSVYNIAIRSRRDSLRPISEALMSTYDRISEAAQNKGGITGTPTGFADLDALTSGFSAEQLVVLAARPGKGKTSFALNIAHNVAAKHNMPVAIFSLEMSAEDLALRLMCADAKVSISSARSGRLSEDDFSNLLLSMRELSNSPIYIDAEGTATIPEIRAKCMRLSAREPLGLIVIDYLQLMSSSASRVESRQQEISELTRAMKMLARDIGAPVLILSQLNRDIERRANKEPMLADLRESGSIEQDADIVIFLAHDADMIDEDDDDGFADESVQNGARAIVAKNRNGPTGDVPLLWLAEYTTFTGVSAREEM